VKRGQICPLPLQTNTTHDLLTLRCKLSVRLEGVDQQLVSLIINVYGVQSSAVHVFDWGLPLLCGPLRSRGHQFPVVNHVVFTPFTKDVYTIGKLASLLSVSISSTSFFVSYS
jgi:hypothetical protein